MGALLGSRHYLLLQTGWNLNPGWMLPGQQSAPQLYRSTAGIFVRGTVNTVRAGSDTPQGGGAAQHSLPTYLLFDRDDRPDRFLLTPANTHTLNKFTIYPADLRADALADDDRLAVVQDFGSHAAFVAATAAAAAAAIYGNAVPVGVAEVDAPPIYDPDWGRPPAPRWVVRAFETTRCGDKAQTTAWLDDWPTQ